MKIAVAGKGGAGKTTITAIMARTLARSGRQVIAVDADANPNLGVALGLGTATQDIKSIKNELYEHPPGHQRSEEHDIDHLVQDFGVHAPDRVRLLQTGTVERPSKGCLCCGSHATLRDVLDRIPAGDKKVVITDLEAGVNDLLWARPRPEDILVIVVDPSQKSLEVGKRIRAIAQELGVRRVLVVANRVQREDDLARARNAFADLEITAVPEDPLVREADRRAASAFDAASTGPAVLAISQLNHRL